MKKPFTLFSKLLPVALAWGLGLTAAAQVNYSTVPLTAGSFSHDVIANGSAALLPANSTTNDVDAAGYYLISQDYYTASTPHTSGLPNSGLIPNSIAGYSNLTYQLASYSANNSLRISPAGSTGTVTFATPTAAAELYVLAISGSGASTVTMTVNYSDGTNTAFAGQTYPDWFTASASQNVFGASARASAAAPVSATAAANTAPFLSQVKLTVPAAKTSTTVTGITFTTATGSGVLNILAVSAGTPAPNCAAAPTTLTTVASTTAGGGTALSAACPSTSIYLSVSGVPNNSGYTYQWQSSTTSATTGFSNISGATSSTYTATGQTVTTYYRVLVGCQYAGTGSTPTTATAVQITQNAPTSCYCTPTYTNGGSTDNILNVQLGTLNNPTTGNASPYYRDYSAQQTGSAATLQIPAIAQGSTATVRLTLGTDGTQYSAVWIDFNQNGTFETTEFFSLNTSVNGSGTPVAIPVAVPATATLGQTKMRVRGGEDNIITSDKACGASTSGGYGEAEDYLVNIVAAGSCTATAATFSYPAASFCTNATTAPTVTLASGATAGTFSSTTGLTINATTGAITLSSSTPGTYIVTNTVAATATTCASSATTTVTVAAAPATPTLTTSGTAATGITLTSSAASGNQFYLNGNLIPGATGTSYLVNSGTKNGQYIVIVTNAAGCSAISAPVNITVTAAATAQASTALTVAPNPTRDGLLTLELSGFRETVALTVTNALGQRVVESTVAGTALGQKQTLNLSALPAGVYLLQARTASGAVETRRIVRE
ncbi:MAG TPA: GEVED domain-containing protein [Hymenobacter sp.]|uniref:GEVED domain-containing protein n=1 Tax=Hymenobacter sp. TaxID=1898978 RepID=UPI002D7EB19D|nr:GEVED domain-containing protein [Hymenobacter sp.]HET9502948.1 GEVED domain-containing protein [Hymenobacter sp.]